MKPYSLGSVVLLVDGVNVTELGKGDDVVQFKRRAKAAEVEIGANGDGVVILSNDESVTIAFKLLKTSGLNAFFSGLLKAQTAGRLTGVILGHTVRILDIARQDLAVGYNCVIEGRPDNDWGEKPKDRDWVFIGEKHQAEDGIGVPVIGIPG